MDVNCTTSTWILLHCVNIMICNYMDQVELRQVWYVLYNTWILLHLLTLMNYNKWGMICTVQYMDLTPPVNIDELQQVEYDMYCTINVSYSTCWHWWITTSGVWYVLYNTCIVIYLLTLMNYNKWSMICAVQYMDPTPPVDIDNYNKWSMMCTVQYMDLTPPVNIDELQQVGMICTIQHMDLTPPVDIDELLQVEYDMYCTIHGSYFTC